MKKKFFLIFLSLLSCLCVFYNAVIVSNRVVAQSSTYSENVSGINMTTLEEEVKLSTIFEKRDYRIDEDIFITFNLGDLIGFQCSSIIETTNYKNNGFVVIKEPYLTPNNLIAVTLKYTGETEKVSFVLDISIKNHIMEATIFGVKCGEILYLSNHSYEAALRHAYFKQNKNGKLSNDEYTNELKEISSSVGYEYYTSNNAFLIQESSNDLSAEDFSGSEMTTQAIGDTSTLTGKLEWIDNNEVLHPLQFIKVEIYDYIYQTLVGTVYTNTKGIYSFSYTGSESFRQLYIKVYPGGVNSIVVDGDGGEYSYISSMQSILQGQTKAISWAVDMESDLGQAFQISQPIVIAAKYVRIMNNQEATNVIVKYPHNETKQNTYYNSLASTIYLEGGQSNNSLESYESWDVIMHEYGHHIAYDLNIISTPGGKHYFSSNNIDYRFEEYYSSNEAKLSNAKYDGIRLGWSEAWATVFGTIAQQYFADILRNIDTVADSSYDAYNNVHGNLETTMVRLGEGCELSVIGVLYDWFDDHSDTAYSDTVAWGHEIFWTKSKNSQAKTFSQFVSYVYSNASINGRIALGSALQYYGMAATNINPQISETDATISWKVNGGSNYCPNNEFEIVFYDSNMDEIYRTNRITTTKSSSAIISYTLSNEEREFILCNSGANICISIVAYQTVAPSIGGYSSSTVSVLNPIFNKSESGSFLESTRYIEKSIFLTTGGCYNYSITFEQEGSKIIQTFGDIDTIIEIYSLDGALLKGQADTDNNGYESNAFINYYVNANTTYIIKVKLAETASVGSTKLAIISADSVAGGDYTAIGAYDQIFNISYENYTWFTFGIQYNSKVVIFTPPTTGIYTISLESEFDNYLYVIDPRDSNFLEEGVGFVDDVMNTNASITRNFQEGITYLIIYCPYNPADGFSDLDSGDDLILTVQKNL